MQWIHFGKAFFIGAILSAMLSSEWPCTALAADEPSVVDAVEPLLGTNAFGHTYPGASLPFGMVQLSPDTANTPEARAKNPMYDWDHCAGYHYADPMIVGFSHNHLTGTGCPELGNILVRPGIGSVKSLHAENYPLLHDQEAASPGYYRINLANKQIKAELTATDRCGMHRYTFDTTEPVNIFFDANHGLANQTDVSTLTVESDRRLSGSRKSTGFGGTKTFYFVAEFSRPFKEAAVTQDGKAIDGKSASGKAVWGDFEFDGLAGQPVVVKVGISAVSVDGARANLKSEIPGFDFDHVAAAAREAWQKQLSRIEATVGDDTHRRMFYTALYHTQMCPSLFCDVDGSFWGPDGKSHPSEGFSYYTSFSLWDTFRAENALLILMAPERLNDMVNTMLAHYRLFVQHTLPTNVYVGHETWCMIGNHAIPTIAEIYVKGIRGFDANAALDAMILSMDRDGRRLKEYRDLGYIVRSDEDSKPGAVGGAQSPDRKQSVSQTLEYAYNDACVARYAAMLNRADDAKANAKRGNNWQNVFDRTTGFMRGKTADGKFVEPFDPRRITFDDYTEANAWQYSFFVPQDVAGLIHAMGGDKAFVQKLDTLFDSVTDLPVNTCDVTGLIGQYAHGNEPCHHVAYLYNYAGEPWKTAQRVRHIMKTQYSDGPAGLSGNDDCGQMSAWYVWSALGMYPVDPMSCIYMLGSPLVNKATIRLNPKYAKGGTFAIVAHNNSPKNMYVQSATLNGKPLNRSWISHQEITDGGELVFEMGPKPNVAWGAAAEDRPPQAIP
jgi:predicted alpha-1,2-mannosidase